MNKLHIAAGLALLIALGGLTYYIKTRCEEPTELQVAIVQFECTLQILNRPVEEIISDACAHLGKEPACQFEESDKAEVLEMIDEKVYLCAKAALEAKNQCTDMLEKGLVR